MRPAATSIVAAEIRRSGHDDRAQQVDDDQREERDAHDRSADLEHVGAMLGPRDLASVDGEGRVLVA